jgi:hypothetical protein
MSMPDAASTAVSDGAAGVADAGGVSASAEYADVTRANAHTAALASAVLLLAYFILSSPQCDVLRRIRGNTLPVRSAKRRIVPVRLMA